MYSSLCVNISAGWKVKMKWWRCRVFFLVGHVTLLIPQDAARSIQPGTARAEGCTKSTMYYGLYFLVMSRITLCTRDGLLMAGNSSGWECNMIWSKMYTCRVDFREVIKWNWFLVLLGNLFTSLNVQKGFNMERVTLETVKWWSSKMWSEFWKTCRYSIEKILFSYVVWIVSLICDKMLFCGQSLLTDIWSNRYHTTMDCHGFHYDTKIQFLTNCFSWKLTGSIEVTQNSIKTIR